MSSPCAVSELSAVCSSMCEGGALSHPTCSAKQTLWFLHLCLGCVDVPVAFGSLCVLCLMASSWS